MSEIIIRKIQPGDKEAIIDICYRTGFMGKDLTGTGRFNDKKLFGMIFCRYYFDYESENCFAAVDGAGAVAGYIIGTLDSVSFEKEFSLKMEWRIIIRMLFYSFWRYPESFKEVYSWNKVSRGGKPEILHENYPAHFHINLFPRYQGMGIGKKLIGSFENCCRGKGIGGVHLETSNLNDKSIAFYKRCGYNVLHANEYEFWKGIRDHAGVIMGKVL